MRRTRYVLTDRRPHGPLRLAGRFMVGMHLDGRMRSDATFFARGTRPVNGPGFFRSGHASRWARLPGWQRAALRWAAIGVAVGLWRSPHVTEWALALAGGPAAGIIVWRCYRGVLLWRHRRQLVGPLWAVLCHYLDTPIEDGPDGYLSVPLTWDTDPDCRVGLAYPPGWDPVPAVRDRIEEAMSRHLPGGWRVSWGKGHATWRRVPAPPDVVTFEDMRADFEAGPEHLVPVGRTALGAVVRIDVDAEAPHVAYSGGTGAGKSTFLRAIIAYLLRHGAEEVIALDPKRISLLRAFRDHPRVRIIPDSEDWPEAIAEVKTKMERRYRWAEAQPDPDAAITTFRRLVLVVEEGGSLGDMLRNDWRAIKSRNDPAEPPALTDLRHVIFQGRQGRVTVLMVVQQGNARDMGGSSVRDQFGGRVLVRYSGAVWRMLVGTIPSPRAPKHPGRGYVVIGHDEQLVQLVNMTAEEAHDFALEGEPEEPAESPELTAGPVVADTRAGEVPRAELASVPPASPDSGPDAGPAADVRALRSAPRYLTQAEVAENLGMALPAFTKWRQRCRQAGSPLPEPEYFSGRPGWTDDQLAAMAERRAGRAS